MSIWNKFRYANWKRLLAIVFSVIALVGSITGYAITMINSAGLGSMDNFTNMALETLSVIVMLLVAYYLLDGNVRNSNSAYRGVLSFVMIMALNGVLDILDFIIQIAAGGFAEIFLNAFMIVLAVASAVIGFVLYRKIMGYLAGSYMAPTYKNLMFWTIAFVVVCVLYSITMVVYSAIFLAADPLSLYSWAAFVSVLPNIAFPLAILFTTMRLAH